MKIALVGDVALNLLEPYFLESGFETYSPSGFGTWRQELLDENSPLHKFKPDLIFDVTSYDNVLSQEVENFFDERMKTLAKMPYSLAGIKAIVEEAKFAILSKNMKILAVDADNTLWHGILSEDGKSSLIACNTFQNGLLSLRKNGVVLILLTKNDPTESFMREDMTLKDDDFTLRQINWSPKAGNLIEACKKLNLSTDSVVFLDDNPFERAQMASHLPSVTIAPWEGWKTNAANDKEERQLIRRLKKYFFSTIGLTKEDMLRNSNYESSIRHTIEQFSSAKDYLKSLQLRVIAREAKEDDLVRLEQMAGKTNQFNATTLRRTKKEFEEILKDKTKKIFIFHTFDKYAEQGIVCYIIVDLLSKHATDFVMSCRAMGRTLEYFAWQYVINALGFEPVIDFTKTAKNKPFELFLSGNLKEETFYVS